MFGSTVLEVGVGVALLFLFVSLICTAFQEGLEAILKSRAADLERGIRLLLHDGTGEGAARAFFAHPLIYSLFSGDYQPGSLSKTSGGGLRMPRKHRKGLPSYIPAANFSAAVIDLVATGKLASAEAPVPGAEPKPLPATPAEWRAAAALVANPEIREAVRAAFELGGGDFTAARANLETWYNGTMDRVSGWYKRRAQGVLFVVGLLIAVGLNIDAVTVVRELSTNAELRQAAVAAAERAIQNSSADAVPASADSTATEADSSAAGAPEPTPPTAEDAPAGGTGETSGPANASSDAAPGQPESDYERARDAIGQIGYPAGWQPAPQLRVCRASHSGTVESDGLAWAADGSWTLGRCGGGQLAWLAAQALVGWLATALAVMLGAPFWFDVLNKFMVIRSTVKSYEKSPPEGSEDRQPRSSADQGGAPRARGMP